MKKRIFIFILFTTIISNGYSNDNDRYDVAIFQNVLSQLNISENECEINLLTQKQLPYIKGYSVFVIPKIGEGDDDFKIFDAYILMIENETGKITHKFYQEKAWTSDAVRLENIEIDTAPYKLNNNTRAFGVRCFYEGSSRPNLYASEEILLFIPREKSLVRVLKDYIITEYHGEWDTNCEGEFTAKKGIFVIGENKTNEFYDIIVKNTYTTQTNTKVDDDCVSIEETSQSKETLQYVNGEYKLKP